MKAIQVKYLPCTNTKSSRLKVWAESCKPLIHPLDYDKDIATQAEAMIRIYISLMDWSYCKISGFGSLPNGDYVATLKGINE